MARITINVEFHSNRTRQRIDDTAGHHTSSSTVLDAEFLDGCWHTGGVPPGGPAEVRARTWSTAASEEAWRGNRLRPAVAVVATAAGSGQAIDARATHEDRADHPETGGCTVPAPARSLPKVLSLPRGRLNSHHTPAAASGAMSAGDGHLMRLQLGAKREGKRW